jgi:hypothetical protein
MIPAGHPKVHMPVMLNQKSMFICMSTWIYELLRRIEARAQPIAQPLVAVSIYILPSPCTYLLADGTSTLVPKCLQRPPCGPNVSLIIISAPCILIQSPVNVTCAERVACS